MAPRTSPRPRPPSGAILPADLLKLRERFARAFPGAKARANRLALVPAAFRHLLSMQLELDRDDTLPRRYRRLVEAGGADAMPDDGDAVDRLVIAFGRRVNDGDVERAGDLLPDLKHYFTEPQIVEMTLAAVLARGLSVFDAVLGGGTRGTGPPARPRPLRPSQDSPAPGQS